MTLTLSIISIAISVIAIAISLISLMLSIYLIWRDAYREKDIYTLQYRIYAVKRRINRHEQVAHGKRHGKSRA